VQDNFFPHQTNVACADCLENNFISAGQQRCHRLIDAGQIPTSYLQAKFFLSNQCCKADCLENTVNFSGGTRPTFFSVLPATSCGTREPGLSKAPPRAASFAGASILRLRLHSTMVA
jgi:hypothetical protein